MKTNLQISLKGIINLENLDKSKTYKIVDNTNDSIYIGSTCKTLKDYQYMKEIIDDF